MITFDDRNIEPMLIGREEEPFDNLDYIFELKWDGERCIAFLDPKSSTDLRNKRNIKMLSKVPELSEIHKQVKARCILDGELMILKNGKPDFFEIQRRSLTSNKFKIELAAKKYPATFVAYDILFYNNKDVTGLTLMERKKLLQKAFTETERLALSKYIEEKGIDFYRLAEAQELEGIVAKHKDSIYFQGKRTKDWVKMKYLKDEDFYICGYIHKKNNMISLVLADYDDNVLVYKGHVTMGVDQNALAVLQQLPTWHPPERTPPGHDNEDAIWVQPIMRGTVRYMPRVGSEGRHQSVFKGFVQ